MICNFCHDSAEALEANLETATIDPVCKTHRTSQVRIEEEGLNIKHYFLPMKDHVIKNYQRETWMLVFRDSNRDRLKRGVA